MIDQEVFPQWVSHPPGLQVEMTSKRVTPWTAKAVAATHAHHDLAVVRPTLKLTHRTGGTVVEQEELRHASNAGTRTLLMMLEVPPHRLANARVNYAPTHHALGHVGRS